MKERCWWGGKDDVGAPNSSGPIPYYVLEARVKSPICFRFLFLIASSVALCFVFAISSFLFAVKSTISLLCCAGPRSRRLRSSSSRCVYSLPFSAIIFFRMRPILLLMSAAEKLAADDLHLRDDAISCNLSESLFCFGFERE